MAWLIPITDSKKRDAHIAVERPAHTAGLLHVAPDGAPTHVERLIRLTERTQHDALLARFGDGLARALVDGDPEIDLAYVGRRLGDAARVYVRPDGTLLTTARLVQVTYGADGVEKSRQEFVDVEATVREEGAPLVWSGRLFPVGDVVRKFAFVRKLALRHVSGLTFDFLFDIAKTLHEADKVLYMGTGPKGQNPLILQQNGSPYRGFLEGRIQGDSYKLVLHLSNLELKPVGGTP
ncbi:MAG: hypothetical protein WCI05_18495 [Myxococcales bacterium]|jgi:hypothetical protein